MQRRKLNVNLSEKEIEHLAEIVIEMAMVKGVEVPIAHTAIKVNQ
jgi:hypothetical protein